MYIRLHLYNISDLISVLGCTMNFEFSNLPPHNFKLSI